MAYPIVNNVQSRILRLTFVTYSFVYLGMLVTAYLLKGARLFTCYQLSKERIHELSYHST